MTTWNDRRDRDLRSPDFFDVERYPTAVFSSRSIEKNGEGFLMRGSLTIHGMTREVAVPFTYLGHVVDSGGAGHRLGFEGRFTIDRREYGVIGPSSMNKLTSLGKLMIGENVDLELSIQGWQWTPARLMDSTADSLFEAIGKHGIPAVARRYRQAHAAMPESLMAVDEGVLNAVGHHLLVKQRAPEAVDVFRLEAEAYPGSAFAQVGLGQAYAMVGNREHAIASCDSALKIRPGATRAIEILRRLRGG